MPQAKRSTSTASRFKQPPALKRLSTSLDTAQSALAELSKGSGRDVSKGAGDLYKDLRTFVSNARRDSNKLAKALQKEFDQAQKQLAKAAKGTTTGRSSSTRSTTTKRAASSRSTSSRSSSSRSSSSRATGGRATTKRASTSGTKRAPSKRRTSKS